MKHLKLTFVLVVLLSSVALAQSAPSPEARLKAAMNLELVDRDIPVAIAAYKQIAEDFAANHTVAPKALLQLGAIYERTGHPDAQATYQRIVNQYPDAGVAFTTARARLAAIQQAAAGPFKVRELDPWLQGASLVSTSPDGKSLAYTRLVNEKSTAPSIVLLVREFAGGRERVLAEFGVADKEAPLGNFVWSPDSRHLAFAVFRFDAADRRIITVATKASRYLGAVGVGHARYFRWSPDGRKLAAVTQTKDRKNDMTIFALGSNEAVSVGEPLVLPGPAGGFGGVVWSPDSQRVAFVVASPSEADQLRVLRPGSTESITIAVSKPTSQSRTTLIGWTAANDVHFSQSTTGGNDFFLVNASGGSPRRICEGRGQSGGDGCNAMISPDGRWQIVRRNVAGGGKIVLRSLQDGSERPLSREAVVETLVAFSPDSRLVAFRSNRDGADGVYVVPIDGTPVARPVKITSVDFDANVSATWTPDRLVMRIANNQVNLYRVDVNPSNRRVLAEPLRLTEDSPVSNNPQVSPDGRRIAYVSRGRPSGFAVMNANGTNERVFKELPVDVFARMNLVGWISETEVLITDPGPGPDAPRTVPKKLLGINVLTGTSRSVGPDSYGVSFQLLAGGNLLFQVPGPGNDVLTIRPLTGGVAATTTVPIADWWGRAASADGRWLAYSTVDASPGRGKPWPGDIRVRSLDSGIERVLLKFADSNSASHAPLDLSADGKWLIYQDPKLTLRIADCETGESWPLLVNAPSEVDFEWPLVRWAPDGSFIVLSGTISRATYRAYEGIAQDAVTKAMTGRK